MCLFPFNKKRPLLSQWKQGVKRKSLGCEAVAWYRNEHVAFVQRLRSRQHPESESRVP